MAGVQLDELCSPDVDSQLAEINLEALEPLGQLFFEQSDVTCVCGDWSPVWEPS